MYHSFALRQTIVVNCLRLVWRVSMISESKVILLPLRGIALCVTFPKVSHYGVMAIISLLLWNHAPFYLSVGWLPTNLNLRHLPSITPGMCFVSRLKTCFNISFHELILSARSSRRSFPIEFLSVAIVLDEDLESKDVKINWSNEPTSSRRAIGSTRLW